MASFAIDIFGMAETNSGWQHRHLQEDFKLCARRQFQLSRTTFGFPSVLNDPLTTSEKFHAGGSIQVVQGVTVTTIHGSPILDPTGLGRWCGNTFQGHGGGKMSIITGYRTCSGSINTSPLGSTYRREYEYLRANGHTAPQPRKQFLQDLSRQISELQRNGHAILLMLDDNATLERDRQLVDFMGILELTDLHSSEPATSTYIGHPGRRIDFMFGCERIRAAVNRSGTLSYFQGPQSDHRALYIDLNLPELFGGPQTKDSILKATARGLRSGNPELVALYIKSMQQYYADHNMMARIDKLYETHRSMPRSQVRKLLISWDNDQGKAMKDAETILSIPPKQYQWSPKLRNAGVLYRYWKLRLRELVHAEDYRQTFERWERQIQEQDSTFELPLQYATLTPTEARQHLAKATKTLRQVQKDSVASRNASYQDLLDKYDDDNESDTRDESQRKAKIVRQTIKGENVRSMFHKLRQIVKPSEFTMLDKIEIPRNVNQSTPTLPGNVHTVLNNTLPENILWDTVISKSDIEEHILNFNRVAFRAASESPCGSGMIHEALRFTSLTKEAKALLYGVVPREWYGDDALLQDFLASFKIPDTVLDLPPISTKISNADISKCFRSWKESTTTSPSGRHLGHYKAIIQDTGLLHCLRKFIQIAVDRGIAIPRWSRAINVMIEKDPGKPKINRLRIIHLFEADYNMFLKLMWGSRLVKRAVSLDLLNSGQHGSVPGRTTMAPIMLNQLTTDLCRMLKVNYLRFDNDASACFDRIIVAMGMMAARRCGMPRHAVRTHAKALEMMRYTVKTVYGISDKSYRGTKLEPLFGTGQGSGASPSVWLTLVVLLLNTLDKVTPDRTRFQSPDGKIEHTRLVDAFVDDTAIGITDDEDQQLEILISRLEKVAQTWEKLLHYSGGALNLSKCSWYVMSWDWKNGRPQLREPAEADPGIELTQGLNKQSRKINRYPLNQATRILGVYQTPVGDFSKHIQVLKTKADTYAGYLKSPRLTPMDIRVFHRTIYAPAMRYSMAALAVDEEELDKVQSRLISTVVSRLGLSSKAPTAIRYGPISMGGLNLMDLRTENGIEMIKLFRHEVHSKTQMGQLLLLQLQVSQLESGLSNQLLEEPNVYVSYLTPNWILSMRQFMSNHNITITITNAWTPDLKGKHDRFIMSLDYLCRYSPQQKSDINLVRVYLQVTTLHDVCDTFDIKRIARWAMSAERRPGFIDKKHWPRQKAPSSSQIRLWSRYLSSNYLRYGNLWRQSPSDTGEKEIQRPCQEYIDQTERSIPDLIKQLPRSQRRLLTQVEQHVKDTDIWSVCRTKRKVTLSTDGGLKGNQGTFGWQLRSHEEEVLIEGAGPVDGPYDTANSTRCELAGVTAPLLLLALISNLWGKKHRCKIRWVTDSKSAISNVRKDWGKAKQPNNPDYMAIIQQSQRCLKRPIRPIWIKGHQTTQRRPMGKGHRLQDIRGNTRADELATWYRDQSGKTQSIEFTDHVAEANISISINGKRLVSQVENCIRYHVNAYHLRRYIQTKHQWPDKIWDRIDIEAMGIFNNRPYEFR